jgi:hypothetical protein
MSARLSLSFEVEESLGFEEWGMPGEYPPELRERRRMKKVS